jgi:hypothetical protein
LEHSREILYPVLRQKSVNTLLIFYTSMAHSFWSFT